MENETKKQLNNNEGPQNTPKKSRGGKILFNILLFVIFFIFLVHFMDDCSESYTDKSGKQAVEKVETYIKENMNDPTSYEQVKATFMVESDSSVFVTIKFRGKNKFNATVLQTINAYIDKTGEITSFKEMD